MSLGKLNDSKHVTVFLQPTAGADERSKSAIAGSVIGFGEAHPSTIGGTMCASSCILSNPVRLRLVYAGETTIRRYVKIRRDANPFDPQWQPYLVERAFHKKFGITRQQAGIKPS